MMFLPFLATLLLSLCAPSTQLSVRIGGYSSSSSSSSLGSNLGNSVIYRQGGGGTSSVTRFGTGWNNWGGNNENDALSECTNTQVSDSTLETMLEREGCVGARTDDCVDAKEEAKKCLENMNADAKKVLACDEYSLRELASLAIAKTRKVFFTGKVPGLLGNNVESILLRLIPADLRDVLMGLEDGFSFPINEETDAGKQAALKVLQTVCKDDSSSEWQKVESKLTEQKIREIFFAMLVDEYTDFEKVSDVEGLPKLKDKRRLVTDADASDENRSNNWKTFANLLKNTKKSVMMEACIDDDIQNTNEREVYKRLRDIAGQLAAENQFSESTMSRFSDSMIQLLGSMRRYSNFCSGEYKPWKEIPEEEDNIVYGSYYAPGPSVAGKAPSGNNGGGWGGPPSGAPSNFPSGPPSGFNGAPSYAPS